eukprot:CAMPEP_0175137710 /NCGR_PEP_ID=MMETSP0087-20121206/9957_1 /TAXON_ID=136419 /ORGANISM="Unknown Unknown, Strain D1" /LENGTH=818 /DNA_ID=CAMNT_0016420557 /DNA_START=55 /DNA_END=2511 /DNA_ORIENTATION=+
MSKRLIDRTGPAWAKEELLTFFEEHADHGTDFTSIANQLPGRTSAMCRALHAKFRTALSRPNSSSSGFVTLAYEKVGSSEADEEYAHHAAAKRLARQKKQQAEQQQQQTRKKRSAGDRDAAPSKSVAKKQRLDKSGSSSSSKGEPRVEQDGNDLDFARNSDTEDDALYQNSYDSEDEGDFPDESFSSANNSMEVVASSHSLPHSQTNGTSNSLDALHALTEFAEQALSSSNNDIGRPARRRQLRFNSTTVATSNAHHSNNTSSNSDSSGRSSPVSELAQSTLLRRNFRGRRDVAASAAVAAAAPEEKKSQHWRIFEWFYSSADQLYFSHNEFAECLLNAGFGQVQQLPRRDWTFVRKIIGRPRRLSRKFFAEERRKLHAFRGGVRAVQAGLEASDIVYPFQDVCPARLQRGDKVTVWHPELNNLQSGVVIDGVLENQTAGQPPILHYLVKFSNPTLPELIIEDTDLALIDPTPRLLKHQQQQHQQYFQFHSQPTPERNSNYLRPDPSSTSKIHFSTSKLSAAAAHFAQNTSIDGGAVQFQEKDLVLIAAMLKLLDRKKALVDHLGEMNRAVEFVRAHNDKIIKQRSHHQSQQPVEGGAATTANDINKHSTKGNDNTPSAPVPTPQHMSAADAEVGIINTPLSFRQQYAWIVVQLEKSSQELEAGLQQLRYRKGATRRAPLNLAAAANALNFANFAGGNFNTLEIHKNAAAQLIGEVIAELLSSGALGLHGSLTTEPLDTPIHRLIHTVTALAMLCQEPLTSGVSERELQSLFEELVRQTSPSNAKLLQHIEHFLSASAISSTGAKSVDSNVGEPASLE